MLQGTTYRGKYPVQYEINTVVCVRSFFDGVKKSTVPGRMVVTLAASLLAVALLFAALFNASANAPAETPAYAVTLDGIVLGAAEDSQELYGLLEDILNSHRNANTVEIAFAGDVSVEYTMVGASAVRCLDEMSELLGGAVSVTRVDRILTEIEVPYTTITLDSESLYIGETMLISEGEPGVRTVVERVTYSGDVETRRESSNGALRVVPVPEVVAVGTVERPRTMSYGEHHWPTADAVVVSGFGRRTSPGGIGSTNHQGIDIDGYMGQSIYASDGGEVVYSGSMRGFGRLVQIRHDNGDVTLYAHCSELLARVGDRVARGDVIARMGNTGTSTGVHLHFEIWPGGGAPRNPVEYLAVDGN